MNKDFKVSLSKILDNWRDLTTRQNEQYMNNTFLENINRALQGRHILYRPNIINPNFGEQPTLIYIVSHEALLMDLFDRVESLEQQVYKLQKKQVIQQDVVSQSSKLVINSIK